MASHQQGAPQDKAVPVPVDAPDYPRCLEIARRVRASGCSRVGLIAAGQGIDVEAVALRLAAPLADLLGAPVAVLTEGAGSHDERAWAAREVSLVVLDATRARDLQPQVLRAAASHACVLVPLDRLERRGEHRTVLDVLDGVVVVARAGSREHVVRRQLHAIAPVRHIGVLLLSRR